MTVRAVIFDIGQVLVEWNPERFYDTAFGERRRRALFDAVDLCAMNAAVDLGSPFGETVEALAAGHPEWRELILAWRDRWIEMFAPEIPGSVAILQALRERGVPVYALSNFGRETFETAEANYPFLRDFDRRYISGHLRMMKPDQSIYAHVEADCGLQPESLLFADDRPENIAAAAARGWKTHLFQTPEGWAARLAAESLPAERTA